MALFSGVSRPTRFICWLDDYSRYIIHLEAYADDQLPSLEDSLKKGALKHGLSRRIFVDNGLIYSCQAFSLTCADLGICKVHSTPGYPPSRGKVERLFRTLRSQFIRELENIEPQPIEKVNRYLTAWVDKYHHRTHSETEQTPDERYRQLDIPRMLSPEKLYEAFLQWDTRTISSAAEIKFEGNRYYVDPSLANRKNVVIRYDPYDLSCIHIWERGKKIATATTNQLITRQRLRKGDPLFRKKTSETARRYLQNLEEAHQNKLARELNLIRYHEENKEE